MKYLVEYLENSLEDYYNGMNRYDKISENLADKFYDLFWSTMHIVKENPLIFQIRYRNIRIAFTPTFPYGIHFIVENNLITIYKVLHTKRLFK